MFSGALEDYYDVSDVILTNSGSSSNLLAVSALTSEALGDRRLVPGDEVITVAAGFPSTVAPIVQNRLVPVFVDVEIGTYNIDVAKLEEACRRRSRPFFSRTRWEIPSTSTPCASLRRSTASGSSRTTATRSGAGIAAS
jgi:CDP-6-deoxy-D-xylo-4-hexulose-3-dehydrase